MAQCKQTPQEFIKNAFTPQIAVLCTPLAEGSCQKNNLNFIELLQPFSKLSNDVHYKDPAGTVITIRNLKLTFLDVNSRPPQTTLARKFLNSSVSELSDFRTENFTTSDHTLNITLTTPWFEAWRDTFLRVQYPSDHEYTKHFLSCVLVVSSAEINVIESIIQLSQSLNQMQNNAPGKLPKWFSSNVLKYYVIIHDNVEGNIDVANEAYESVKGSYGEANCFLLRMNSRPPGAANTEHLPDPWSQFISCNIESRDYNPTPESSPYTSRAIFDTSQDSDTKTNLNYHPLSPDTEDLIMSTSATEKDKTVSNNSKLKSHGLCLSTEDVEQVKLFLHEFTKTCLLPYIEKQIHQLSDVISNKKGVSRSLFSATKRWFNPNKPGASSVAVNNLIYAPDSPELQVRRLGDLYFMFGHYLLAFQAYHLAKRDYNTDQAWLYYAGALEMAALAAFMANESSRKTYDYMEESITTYMNTCKMPQFATRATLLSSECLKSRGLFGEAAHQLIRMTSEESDLRSALFLEQAAYCFLHSKMVRKYAFHMVLAGHRFSKAAQRKHSLRSYKQAHQIYEYSGWDLAEDHIHYTIGRQAHNLHSFDEAVKSFARLLNGDSKQSGQQQSVFLKEYLTILGNKLLKEDDDGIPILALPELDSDSLKLLMEPTPPLTTPGKVPAMGVNFLERDGAEVAARWNKLEEILVQEAFGSLPLTFKPMITLYSVHNLAKNVPTAIVNEPIQVCVQLINSLQIVLQLKDIYLIWCFKNDDLVASNENNSNNVDNFVKTHVTKSILLQSNCNQNIILALTPLVTGVITLKGICYTLTSSNTPTDNIFIKGKQLFNFDKSGTKNVEIKVVPLAPCLQVTFSEFSLEFLCDEVQKVTIDFQNTGTLPLHKVYMATSAPEYLCNCETKTKELPEFSANCTPAMREKFIRDNHITSVPLPNDRLEPGQSTTVAIFIKAPNVPGPCLVDLLIYYENANAGVVPRYRLVRHKWNLSVQESIKVDVTVQESFNAKQVEEIAVVLKASNLNKLHSSTLTEISLLNVGMLSKFWSFIENVVTPKYINLHSQESAHILLKARRLNEKKSVYSNIYLNHERSMRQHLSSAYIAFAKKTEHCQVNLFNEFESSPEGKDGIVFVQWQALVNDPQKRVVDGQTQIRIKVHKTSDDQSDVDEFAALSDPATLLEVSLNKDKQSENRTQQTKVTCTLIYPAIVEHNFQKEKFCVVPVTLLLHSVVTDADLSVIVNTLGATSGPPPPTHSDLFYPYASKNFSWLGTGSAVREVKPLATEPVKLSAVVSRPGTFDLGARIEIFCSSTDQVDAPELQTCQIQSALIVIDGDS
ncbi:trafficking protein particle complex subunit 8 [Tribolium castaneum]|uniref:Trafficking protein particle complex subunit 8-like Protein n=1 Tax=Tribolium castaneum TaxID=7070 RepID=D6W7M6_TRICA|nr:PREDICTED: trafficking protein particle complex subunit 8 [Tribolium castaneum]EFA11313.1 Trafficking protein particle complex subunit 8-like Protein [Tribolium castaneum]|eukprot:XP_971938.1 PREDICTED: trafficking protein particle complex subunit 8 [Tribolium castaneum]